MRSIKYQDLSESNYEVQKMLIDAAKSVIESGWYINGKNVKKFEQQFSKQCSNSYVSGVSNGLDALILSLRALKIIDKNCQGGVVLVSSSTYIATIFAIIKAGFVPRTMPPDLDTLNLDLNSIKAVYDHNVVGILVTHMYGNPCEMSEISKFCDDHNIFLIEDCAQSHFACHMNKQVGTFGAYGCFSFYPSKNIGALGDAGAVVCKTERQHQIIETLRNYGSSEKYIFDLIGGNHRLDEIQAAMLMVQLERSKKIIEKKQRLALIYDDNLDPRIKRMFVKNHNFCVYHIYPILINDRNTIKQSLLEKGIETEIHYPVPPSRQPALRGFDLKHCQIADQISSQQLSLPISVHHSESEILYVCEQLNQLMRFD